MRIRSCIIDSRNNTDRYLCCSPGTCEQGRLTAGGLQDAIAHGKDFYSVYGPHGPSPILSQGVNEKDLYIRTSTEDRTFQVAGGLLAGMGYYGDFATHAFPGAIDSIPPSYPCAYANSLRDTINGEQAYTDHLATKQDLFNQLNAVVGTAGISAWNSWIDHHFDAMVGNPVRPPRVIISDVFDCRPLANATTILYRATQQQACVSPKTSRTKRTPRATGSTTTSGTPPPTPTHMSVTASACLRSSLCAI